MFVLFRYIIIIIHTYRIVYCNSRRRFQCHYNIIYVYIYIVLIVVVVYHHLYKIVCTDAAVKGNTQLGTCVRVYMYIEKEG